MSDEPLIQGINAAFVGVTNPDDHLKFYCDQLGFAVAETGRLSAAEASAIWGEGVGEIGVTVLTAAGADHGRIVLLQVPNPGPAVYPHSADFGLAGIDLYTRDIQESHRVLTAAGYSWVTPPATWEVPLGEKVVTVTEGFCNAPEGTAVVFVQPAVPRGTAAWDAEPDRFYTELTSVVCHVPDFESEIRFWGPDGLGLSQWYDATFSHPGLDEMASLPSGTVMRLSFLAGPTTARIEVTCIQNRTMGRDRRAEQRTARHLGHTGWLVRTRDLDATVARVRELGGTVLTGPVPGPKVLFAEKRVAMVDTPNGIPVTFVEHAS
ncbi:MAG TPA: VOC family protein [Micromonospora sp.]